MGTWTFSSVMEIKHVLHRYLVQVWYGIGLFSRVVNVWDQVVVPQPVLPSPTNSGWRHIEDGSYEPPWTTLLMASKNYSKQVSYGCKKTVVTAAKRRLLFCNALDCVNTNWDIKVTLPVKGDILIQSQKLILH